MLPALLFEKCVCMCVNVCTCLYPPGYSHEHEPEALMIGCQYYAYRQQEGTKCINIEVTHLHRISDNVLIIDVLLSDMLTICDTINAQISNQLMWMLQYYNNLCLCECFVCS